MPEIRVILNPAAAKGGAARMLPDVRRLMDAQRLDYEVVVTECPGHAAESAEEAAKAGYALVAAAGGDGTCNEVVNGLMKANLGRRQNGIGPLSPGSFEAAGGRSRKEAPGHRTDHLRQASNGDSSGESLADLKLAEAGKPTNSGSLPDPVGESYHPTVLAVLPIGRGNDFAFSASIPRRLADAVELIRSGQIRPVDSARVIGGDYPNGRFFINGLGIGFEPLVNLTASRYRRLSGTLSYLAAVIEIMRNYPAAVPLEIAYQGKQIETLTQQISVCNGRRMGGAFLMGPDAEIDDGHLDLCYVNGPVSGGKILYLVSRFFRGTQKSHPAIASDVTGDLRIRTADGSRRLICHIDGEMVSTGTDELTIEFFPGSLLAVTGQ